MSFFKRHPRLWLAVWVLFGLDSLILMINAVFNNGFGTVLFVKGLIGIALAGTMIAYLLPKLRTENAQN